MKKSQIIFIVAGLVMVATLYSLPMIVVENDGENLSMEEDDLSSDFDSTGALHNATLSAEAQSVIEKLVGEMDVADDKEKFVIFADSIASFYEEGGKLDSAAYFYGLAAEKYPDLNTWEKAGNAYYEAFGYSMDEQKTQALASKTRAYLNKVLEKNPERLDLKTKVAMTYVSSPNPMQGITMLRDILEEDPQNEAALFNMGILSMQSGQYKKAVERFELLVANNPEHIQGQFYLGVCYFESKQRNKARKQFEMLKNQTDDPQVLSGIENYLERL
jgi:tetratricopeptide (TPR) repeat protein